MMTDNKNAAKEVFSSAAKYDHGKLKHADVQEKSPLPDKDMIAIETQMNMKDEILAKELSQFSPKGLKHAETAVKNPLPDKDVIATERAYMEQRKSIESFDPAKLKHVDAKESVLPDKTTIEQEKSHLGFIHGIEGFDKEKMRKAETVEKNPLPTKDVIEQEKKSS